MLNNRKLVSAIIVIGACATLLCAADFWQKKKYSEWNQTEIKKMLSDSPWAKQVEVSLGQQRSLPSGGRGRRGGGGMSDGGMLPNADTGITSGGGMSGSRSTPADSDMGGGEMRMSVIVRFQSALPVKQAVARAKFGDEVLQSPEANKFLTHSEDSYIIGISGLPRMPMDPAKLKEGAQLTAKGKEPIGAANVLAERAQQQEGQRTMGTLYFVFPKGAKPFTLDDDTVELKISFGTITLKHRFKLKEMVFDGKLEL